MENVLRSQVQVVKHLGKEAGHVASGKYLIFHFSFSPMDEITHVLSRFKMLAFAVVSITCSYFNFSSILNL